MPGYLLHDGGEASEALWIRRIIKTRDADRGDRAIRFAEDGAADCGEPGIALFAGETPAALLITRRESRPVRSRVGKFEVMIVP